MAPRQQPACHRSVWQRAKQKQALLLSLVLFCVTGVAANITFKLELNAMPNLPVFVAQLNPIIFTLVFAPVYAYYAWRQSHSKRGNTTTTAVQPAVAVESQPLMTADSRHGAGSVNGTSPEASTAAAGVAMEEEEHQQHLLPQSTTRGWRNAVLLQVACISMLDVTANVIEIVSSMGLGTHAGAISLLLGQSVLPFTVVMSLLILHRRFPWGQLAGAAVVLLGVAVTLLPRLLGLNQHSNSHSTAVSSTATPGRTLFELLYIVMAVPRATNKVWKEKLLSSKAISIPKLAFFETAFELPIGVLVTLVYLPLQPHHPVPWSQLGQWLRSGFQCIGGTPVEACGNAVWAVPLFNACGIAWRLSTLLVIRHGSATLAFMANALLLPVTDMFFDSSIIVGKAAAAHLSFFQVAGLAVVTLGLLTYGLFSRAQPHKAPQ